MKKLLFLLPVIILIIACNNAPENDKCTWEAPRDCDTTGIRHYFDSIAVVLHHNLSCEEISQYGGIWCENHTRERIVDQLDESENSEAEAAQDKLREAENLQSVAPWKRKPITITPSVPPPSPVITNTPAVCYIEFNGATVSGTWWNVSGDIVCGASNLTLDQIKTVMDSAAARFKQFQFNGVLTTDKTLYDATPITRRAMCIVTIDNAWFGSVGGTAFKNTFGLSQPCFVFSRALNYNIKKIQEDVPHELGHVFGLADEFNSSGAYCYCSIMGVGYNLYPPRWSRNDTSVIQSKTN